MCHRSSKSGIRWAGHVAILVELRNAQNILEEKPEGWSPLSSCRMEKQY